MVSSSKSGYQPDFVQMDSEVNLYTQSSSTQMAHVINGRCGFVEFVSDRNPEIAFRSSSCVRIPNNLAPTIVALTNRLQLKFVNF